MVEEIGLTNVATDRIETVDDTVRKTEVEIVGAEPAATHRSIPGPTTWPLN